MFYMTGEIDMSDLQTAEKTKAKAEHTEKPEVYIQSSQALFVDHTRAMTVDKNGVCSMTDAELLAHAENVAKFLGIHRQADPKSVYTRSWDTRYKDLLNSKQYKAAKGQ